MSDPLAGIEEQLADLLYGRATAPAALVALGLRGDPNAVRATQRMVLHRQHRGTGGPRDWYPSTLAAWLTRHPDDSALTELAARFCASDACLAWKEHATPEVGISLEEALFRFFEAHGVGDAATREDEMLGAVVRALAVAPSARFSWPSAVRRAPRGCVAVSRQAVLHAAVDGHYMRGPVTRLIAELVGGGAVENVAARCAVAVHEVLLVQTELARRGLVAA
jgi:hypothetical protein